MRGQPQLMAGGGAPGGAPSPDGQPEQQGGVGHYL